MTNMSMKPADICGLHAIQMGVVAIDGGYPKSIHVYFMQLFLPHYNLRIDPNLQSYTGSRCHGHF